MSDGYTGILVNFYRNEHMKTLVVSTLFSTLSLLGSKVITCFKK